MTRLFRIVLLAVAVAAPLAMTACEDDDPCASDDEECKSDDNELSEDEAEPPRPVPTNPCKQACAALLGECDATDPSFKVNESACTQWCKQGGLTYDETTCLAGVPCGQSADQCLEAE